ncbi:integrase family protein [Roseibium sp. AS2]|uniref:tyrosine-type recombinase/integrase n=1 Tax=Roseibium sp. AS2 TaxID=3135781 RepID=UPI00317B8D9B
MPKLYLDNTFIRNAKCPTNKDQELYWDYPKGLDGKIYQGAQTGLGLRVTSNGIKSFVHTYRFNGKRRRVVVGNTSNMNLGSARLLVHQREVQVGKGEDPDADKVDYHAKHTLLVSDLIEQYWSEHISTKSAKYQSQFWCFIGYAMKPKCASDTKQGKNKVRNYVDFGAKHGNRPVEDIKPTDVKTFLDQFKVAGTWNTAYRHLKAMFNWAIRMQVVDMRNPCSALRQQTALRQRRDYSPEQIKAIADYIFTPVIEPTTSTEGLVGKDKRMVSLANGRTTVQNAQMVELCNFMGILFLTMARPTELTHAKFEHFDLERLIWHKHNTKGIKLSRAASEYAYRSVPIHPKVADLVRQQRSRWPEAELVFPSHADPALPRDNFRKPLVRFKELEGVPSYFQLYDLKRIAISLMLVGQGVRREDVSHYVDHKGNLETTMIYDLGFVDPLRPVTDRLGQLLGV